MKFIIIMSSIFSAIVGLVFLIVFMGAFDSMTLEIFARLVVAYLAYVAIMLFSINYYLETSIGVWRGKQIKFRWWVMVSALIVSSSFLYGFYGGVIYSLTS